MALLDAFGHGTHVASTVAGTGEVPSPFFGDSYQGVAPGASLVSVQISTSGGVIFNGTSLGVGVISSWPALDAVEWVIDHRDELDIRVASNSWGGPVSSYPYQVCTDDPIARALRAGILLEPTLIWVFAAGNEGNPRTIRYPACLPEVITVGAVDREDDQAGFSSEGPTKGDGFPKPDVSAPGVGIVAAQTINPSVYSALNALDQVAGTGPRDPVQRPFYTSSSGTSMATPHVAGLVALMVQAAPCLTQAQAGALLNGTALDLGPAGFDMRYGHGRVRAPQAVAAADALC
jgi:serine protease AprX